MEYDSRQTFVHPHVSSPRLIHVKLLAISWQETWQAAMGFFKDPEVPNDSFSATDLESLIVAARLRLDRISPSDSNTGDQP